ERALELHHETLAIREEIGGVRAIANTCNNIGRVLTELGRPREAETYLKRGLELATEVDAREIVRDATWHLYRLEKSRHDWKAALEHLEHHNEVKEVFLDETTRRAVAQAEARFEAQKREQEISLLQQENQIQRLETSRAHLRTNLLLVLLAGAAGGLLLLFRRYRNLFTFWKRRSYVGHYKIVDQIGSGGMGVVYRAENVVEDSRSYALKVIRDEYATDETVRKRFLHEAAVIDQLDHPHIVAVHERGEHDGRLFMAMELLEGQSLAETINDPSAELSIPCCRHIMTQLIDVVSQIHLKGVLHRDLKPENILLVEREGDPYFVKLLDFGLARTQTLTRLTRTGLIVGTLGYMAPEQITEQACSTAGDIYALGVIFYELLTRQPAFPGDTPVEIIKQILETSPVSPRQYRPEIGDALNELVLSMMAKDPAARPEGAAIAEVLA
ncbi:MAG: protein kinase, partial [Acidobacteriota bacterium]